MKKLLLLIIIAIAFISCDNYPLIIMKDDLTKGCEYAYFEGQKDALSKDVRIKLNEDSVWIWSKSPWDDEQEPIYNPLISLKSNF